jgi:cell division protein FtsQ
MDGGGRLLRSIGDLGSVIAPASYTTAPLAYAGPADPYAFPTLPKTAPRLPRRRPRGHRVIRHGFEGLASSRFLGSALVVALFALVGGYGAVRGGQYDAFIADQGTLPDLVAKLAGFPIKAVTITGSRSLTESEILKLAGVGPRNSLVFLNVAELRERLKAVPLIKDASVSKLYPNRLLIEIEERQPTALWQKNGAVSIVAADGTPIDDMHDARFEKLPLVVGDGANEKLSDYLAILDASGEMRERIRAGMYVAGRRWTLKTDGGIEIDLPETDPADAVARLALLEHDGHILEKDILSLDLRIPGRVVARLTVDAAAARADLLAKKTKKKGATT